MRGRCKRHTIPGAMFKKVAREPKRGVKNFLGSQEMFASIVGDQHSHLVQAHILTLNMNANLTYLYISEIMVQWRRGPNETHVPLSKFLSEALMGSASKRLRIFFNVLNHNSKSICIPAAWYPILLQMAVFQGVLFFSSRCGVKILFLIDSTHYKPNVLAVTGHLTLIYKTLDLNLVFLFNCFFGTESHEASTSTGSFQHRVVNVNFNIFFFCLREQFLQICVCMKKRTFLFQVCLRQNSIVSFQ